MLKTWRDEAEDQLLQTEGSRPWSSETLDDSDEESASESEITMTEDEQRLRDLRGKIRKMDQTLDLLFTHYSPIVTAESPPETNEAWLQLMSHFGNFVLPNRCRHTQFLLFHFAQMSPTHVSLFVKRCLQLAFQEGSSSNHRLVACAYVASFTARGAHISPDSVREIFEILCHYLDCMRQKYDVNCQGPNRRSYSLYYAVAQAVLYIFCFRWRDLVLEIADDDPEDGLLSVEDALVEGRELVWLSGIKEILHKSIYSRLNPLKVCSQSIVTEFAKIAHHLRFIYVFPLLETNKRLRLGATVPYYSGVQGLDIGRRESAWDRKTGEMHHQLEAYFPFDPYNLPRSKRWVAGDYNEWKLPPGMRMEGDDHCDSDDGSEDSESDNDSLLADGGELAAVPELVAA